MQKKKEIGILIHFSFYAALLATIWALLIYQTFEMFVIYIYIYIYICAFHTDSLIPFSRNPSLSAIELIGPIDHTSVCTEIVHTMFVAQLTMVFPCIRIHTRFWFVPYFPACLIHLTWMVCVVEIQWLHSNYFVGWCFRIFSKQHTASFRSSFIYFLLTFPLRDQISVRLMTCKLHSMLYLSIFTNPFR